jgi:hypothetical protein
MLPFLRHQLHLILLHQLLVYQLLLSTLPSWAELLQDLAGLVLFYLTSDADHLSFSAVHRDWCLAAHQQRVLQGTIPMAQPWTRP